LQFRVIKKGKGKLENFIIRKFGRKRIRHLRTVQPTAFLFIFFLISIAGKRLFGTTDSGKGDFRKMDSALLVFGETTIRAGGFGIPHSGK